MDGNRYSPRKVALAYSGGLDTSCIIPWLKENFDGCEAVAVAVNVGQPDDLSQVEAKALASGASKCYVIDAREEFVRDYAFPTLRAGAIYERKYLLGTSMARPVIARRQAEIALLEGCDALAHGCTGKGNDQVRFELTYQVFAPQLQIIAPWRLWHIRSREDALEYAAAHGVPVVATKAKIYSLDGNLWHLSHEGGALEDPWNEPPDDAFEFTVRPEDAPDQPAYVTISFEQGTPAALDGQRLDPLELVYALNEIGGAHGVGRIDLLENRLRVNANYFYADFLRDQKDWTGARTAFQKALAAPARPGREVADAGRRQEAQAKLKDVTAHLAH